MEFADLEKDMADYELDIFNSVTVTYKPAGDGDDRPILALIDYEPADKMGSDLKGRGFKAFISVKNSATEGISDSEFDSGGDMVSLPWPRMSCDVQDRPLKKIVAQDAGMIKIAIV